MTNRDFDSRASPTTESGFALLLVLWAMALLALLVTQFTAASRTEVQVAANLREAAVVEAAADGAVHEAVLRLLQGVWLPDGSRRRVTIGGSIVELRVRPQAGKVNPNIAPPEVLQALLVGVGMDARQAKAIAQVIVNRRKALPLPSGVRLAQYRSADPSSGPASRLYDDLDELGLVPGMTPSLLARIRPLLSVYQEGDIPEPADAFASASAEVLLPTDDPWQFGATGRVMVVMIDAVATGTGGGRFTRQAVVRLRAEPSLDQAPYQVLTWDTPWE